MLFSDKKSGLVRLSDAIKIGLETCGDTCAETVRVFSGHESLYRDADLVLSKALGGSLDDLKKAHACVRSILAPVPEPGRLASLQEKLHYQTLSTVLTSCFALEAYVNSLAYFLLPEPAFKAFDDIRKTIDKWYSLGRLGGGEGFDRSRAPFQDFKVLFRFRDDHVHDKVAKLASNRSIDHYNKKLPDPVSGHLDLSDAIWAALVYWNMVLEVHRLLSVPAATFHQHYNLTPWFNSNRKTALAGQATQYRKKLERRFWTASSLAIYDSIEPLPTQKSQTRGKDHG